MNSLPEQAHHFMENLMSAKFIRKTKWFWPWQDDREETWLEGLSRQGLHLKRARGFGRYEFIAGPPQEYIYRLDFQDTLKAKDRPAYLKLFSDAGWEHLGVMGGWQYFRRQRQPGEENEIFTDPDTKIQKYNRYLTYLGLAFPSYLVVFVALWSTWPEWIMWLNIAVILLCAALALVVSLKIQARIKQLKSL
jgi:hypothetical protein